MNTIQPRFGLDFPKLRPISEYSYPLAGNEYLQLRVVPKNPKRLNKSILNRGKNLFDRVFNRTPQGWLFAHRSNSKAAVHNLTIVTGKDNKKYVHLILKRSPVFGNHLTLTTPGGLWGDQQDIDESIDKAAAREAKEETGYDKILSTDLLADQIFTTSSGMTTELKAFALTRAEGEPSRKYLESSEQETFIGPMFVPLETFTDYDKFQGWLGEMRDRNIIVGMNILALRGLMPPNLDVKA